MRTLKKLVLCLGFMLSLQMSYAGILIEPQLGYVLTGSYSGGITLNGTSATVNHSYNGAEYGARLGYEFLGVMGGLNYSHSSPSLDCKSCSPSVTWSNSRNDIGIFAGYDAPLFIRAWLAYNFSSKSTATQTTTGSTNGDYLKGSSTELGLGFKFIPFISINLIYRMMNYTSENVSNVNYTVSGYKPTEFELAVSAPFNLF